MRVDFKLVYTACHPASVGWTLSQKNADFGSLQTVYIFSPLTFILPHEYLLLIPMQHGFNGVSNLVLPVRRNQDFKFMNFCILEIDNVKYPPMFVIMLTL